MINLLASFIGTSLVSMYILGQASKPARTLYLLGFVLPIMTPHFLSFYFYFLVGPLAIVASMLGKRAKKRPVDLTWLQMLMGWALLVSVPAMLIEYAFLDRIALSKELGLGAMQTTYKMPVQLTAFLMICTSGIAVPMLARNDKDAFGAVFGYIDGVIFSYCFGIVMWLVTGEGMVGRAADVEFEFALFPRIGGLSGEPKMLGTFTLFALVISTMMLFWKPTTKSLIKTSLLALCMLMTLSTSSWFGVVITLCVMPFCALALRQSPNATIRPLLIIGFLGAIIAPTPPGRELIQTRIIDRVFSEDTNEIDTSKDLYFWLNMEESPYMAPTGFGLGGADLQSARHVVGNLNFFRQLQYIRTPTPSLTLLRILGDLGIIGLMLYLGAVYRGAQVCLKSPATRPWAPVLMAMAVGSLFTSWMALSTTLFLLGAFASAARRRVIPPRAPKPLPLAPPAPPLKPLPQANEPLTSV